MVLRLILLIHGYILEKSNTEPIIRIYSEAKSQLEADKLAEEFIEKIKSIS